MHKTGNQLIAQGYNCIRAYTRFTPGFERLSKLCDLSSGKDQKIPGHDVMITIQDGDLPGYGVYVFGRSESALDALDCPGFEKVEQFVAHADDALMSRRSVLSISDPALVFSSPLLASEATLRDYFIAHAPPVPSWFPTKVLEWPDSSRIINLEAEIKTCAEGDKKEELRAKLEEARDERTAASNKWNEEMQLINFNRAIDWAHYWADGVIARRGKEK